MARKVKFALEMADGAKVRSNIEELREHFDMESIISHYLSGKLLEWLEDRYYDDEAIKIADLDKNAPNLNAQLCAIIGVDASEFDALDTEAVERLNEKKAILQQKTSDETIIANAGITALTQEDLADLLDLESPVIYLCGEKFNIPIRVEHKKYVGILGTPKIEIRATSDTDLKEKDILFESVILPWNKSSATSVPALDNPSNERDVTPSSVTTELFELWNSSASEWRRKYKQYSAVNNKWEVISAPGQPSEESKFNSGKIKIALRTICDNKYTENDIVKALIADDFSSACIFTTDAVCLYDRNLLYISEERGVAAPYESGVTCFIVNYSNLKNISILGEALDIDTKDKKNIVTPFKGFNVTSSGCDMGSAMELGMYRGIMREFSNTEKGAQSKNENSIWKLSREICNYLNIAKSL